MLSLLWNSAEGKKRFGAVQALHPAAAKTSFSSHLFSPSFKKIGFYSLIFLRSFQALTAFKKMSLDLDANPALERGLCSARCPGALRCQPGASSGTSPVPGPEPGHPGGPATTPAHPAGCLGNNRAPSLRANRREGADAVRAQRGVQQPDSTTEPPFITGQSVQSPVKPPVKALRCCFALGTAGRGLARVPLSASLGDSGAVTRAGALGEQIPPWSFPCCPGLRAWNLTIQLLLAPRVLDVLPPRG